MASYPSRVAPGAVTFTDELTDPLDGATLDDVFCHLASADDPHGLALCGAVDGCDDIHPGGVQDGRCTGCGKLACPDCEWLNDTRRGY